MIPTLHTLITEFFMTHLAKERNVSAHTIHAYRDTLKMFLSFAAKFHNRKVDHLTFEQLSSEVILEFLNYLEKERGNSARSRNARLAALHSFFRYLLSREPSMASHCQKALTIPFKRFTRPILGYLSGEDTKTLLSQVDRTHPQGERHYLLLALLYDTGARVQELLNLNLSDFRLEPPAFVRIRGKGRRERLCPLLPQTARLVEHFTKRQKIKDNSPLLLNRYGERLSRHGVRYLLKKYANLAQLKIPSINPHSISPHTLRHSKAIHLLQAGLPLITIKDILGHADIKSTEIYVHADLEMKQKALESTKIPLKGKKSRSPISPDLLKWLESL